MIPIHIIGLLYALFYLKEVKPTDINNKEDATYDNPAISIDMPNRNEASNLHNIERSNSKSNVNCKTACIEFFDPQLALHCIHTFIKKRENGLRTIIVLFMLMHFVLNGISGGESQNLFLLVRAKLGWDVDTYVYHNVFTIVAGLIGTLLAVGVVSKIFKVADIYLVLFSTAMSIICRGIYVTANSTLQFFTGTAIDFTFSVKVLAARSIISKIVPGEDLSTIFAIMGLFEALSGFVFPWAYPTFYAFLLRHPDHDVSEMFLLSAILFMIAFIVYSILWKLLRKLDVVEIQNDGNIKEGNKNGISEEDTKL